MTPVCHSPLLIHLQVQIKQEVSKFALNAHIQNCYIRVWALENKHDAYQGNKHKYENTTNMHFNIILNM